MCPFMPTRTTTTHSSSSLSTRGMSTTLQPRRALAAQDGWIDLARSLRALAGRQVTLRLVAHATGWRYENLYVEKFVVRSR